MMSVNTDMSAEARTKDKSEGLKNEHRLSTSTRSRRRPDILQGLVERF